MFQGFASPFQSLFPSTEEAAPPWYLSGGIASADCIAAHQPFGATLQANGYINLNNPGTYNLTPFSSPTWESQYGLKYNTPTGYTRTGITPTSENWSILLKFSNLSRPTQQEIMAGAIQTGTILRSLCIGHDIATANTGFYANGGSAFAEISPRQTSGVIVVAGKSVYLNGSLIGTIGAGAGVPALEIYIGATNLNGSESLGAAIYHQADAVYNKVLSAPEVSALTTAVNALAINRAMIYDGDSLTSGQGASADMDYPAQLLSSLADQSWVKYNFGVGGQTLAAMIADAATQIDPLVSSYTGAKHVVLMGGINDINSGDDATTVYNRIVTYCQDRQSAGFEVTVCTLLAAGTVIGGEETVRQAVNANIVSNYASFADHLANTGGDSRFDEVADTSNPTYYNADTVHLTDTGYGIIAGIAKSAMGLS